MSSNTENDKKVAQIDINLNVDFKKYFVLSEIDHKWGFVISDVGHCKVLPYSNYPPDGHPTSHMFSWDKGRVLNEYQLVLIMDGQGIYEGASTGAKNLNSGDAIILFPGEWHRYKPLKKMGWTEIWIGFYGEMADIVMQNSFFQKENPIVNNCSNILIRNLYSSIFQLAMDEPFGYQKTSSGLCLQLIAEIHNLQNKKNSIVGDDSNISKVKYLMNKNIDRSINLKNFCLNNGISYSKFRADFKYQTGLAPLQYFILLKIEKAKYLFKTTDLKAKQIAYQLGFSSEHYFCRLFKSKTGMTTKEFKENSSVIN
ncbi:AraC family transcriptional regulator [Gaetbulibacter aestuarii]|uniref:AraC family transcriptional regulator n=1 Tax=Gaetbulibacter aestuarii TaxID=1502358 RepID=A0ABW7N112_9FLAO